MTAICLLLLSPAAMAERARSFVDAENHTGYYVYTDSISWDSDHEVTADVVMIRADSNRMFVYQTRFDTDATSCQFMNSRVYRYDTQKLLMQSDTPLAPRVYTPSSPLQQVADYLVSLRVRQESAAED